MNEYEGSHCIKNEKELKKLTIDDCLSCSGCIDSSSLEIFVPLKLVSYLWILSPVGLYNIYEHLNLKNMVYETFKTLLFLFLHKNKQKYINSEDLQDFHLEKTLKEIFNDDKTIRRKIISSYCPGIVSYIEKTYCSLLGNLNQIKGAELLAFEFVSHLIESKECDDIKILSVVSCFDKKIEDKQLESITTQQFLNFIMELKFSEFLNGSVSSINNETSSRHKQRTHVNFQYIEYLINKIPEDFDEIEISKNCVVYKSNNYKFLRVTGHTNILNVLKSYEKSGVEYDFTELWVCEGGCSKGPGNLPVSLHKSLYQLNESLGYSPDEKIRQLANHDVYTPHIDNQQDYIATGVLKKHTSESQDTNTHLSEHTNKLNFKYKRDFSKYKMKKFNFKVEW